MLTEIGAAALVPFLLVDSKALSSDNITSGAVSSVSRPAAKIVEILCQSQKRDLLGVVDVSVSKVNF